MTLISVAADVALDPAAPVDVDGIDNEADSTGAVDVAVVMIDDVAITDHTDTVVAIDDGSVVAVVIVAKKLKTRCETKRTKLN